MKNLIVITSAQFEILETVISIKYNVGADIYQVFDGGLLSGETDDQFKAFEIFDQICSLCDAEEVLIN